MTVKSCEECGYLYPDFQIKAARIPLLGKCSKCDKQMCRRCSDRLFNMHERCRRAAWARRKGVNHETLKSIAEDAELLEVGRKAVEDALIDWRDSRLSEMGRRNGLVIREKNGEESAVIRFGPETALRIGLRAIAEHLKSLEIK